MDDSMPEWLEDAEEAIAEEFDRLLGPRVADLITRHLASLVPAPTVAVTAAADDYVPSGSSDDAQEDLYKLQDETFKAASELAQVRKATEAKRKEVQQLEEVAGFDDALWEDATFAADYDLANAQLNELEASFDAAKAYYTQTEEAYFNAANEIIDAPADTTVSQYESQMAVSQLAEEGLTPVFLTAAIELGDKATWVDKTDAFAEVVNQKAITYAESAINRIVGATDQLWSDVQSQVTENLTAGMDIGKLTKEVQKIGQYTSARASAIARTETLGAYNGGDFAGAEALGEHGPTHKRWLAASDLRTRDSHRRANGQVTEMDQPFKVGSVSMMRPHALGAPAREVVNCRCTTQMYWPGDELPDGSVTIDEQGFLAPASVAGAKPTPLTDAEKLEQKVMEAMIAKEDAHALLKEHEQGMPANALTAEPGTDPDVDAWAEAYDTLNDMAEIADLDLEEAKAKADAAGLPGEATKRQKAQQAPSDDALIDGRPTWTPPSNPDVETLTRFKEASFPGGSQVKQMYRDPETGEQYMFKPMPEHLAHNEALVNALGKRSGLRVADLTVETIDGQTGTFQKFKKDSRAAFPNGKHAFDATKVSDEDLIELQKQRVLDWMVGNHDAHSEQWVRNGRADDPVVVGVDKSQAFKYFNTGEKLDYKWKPYDRKSDPDTVYAAIEKAYAEGRLDEKKLHLLGGNRKKSPVFDVMDALQEIPDDEYAAMLRPYAAARFENGAEEEFISQMVSRKNALHMDFRQYHRTLAKKNKKARADNAIYAESDSDFPYGWPRGMEGSAPSIFSDEFGEEHDHPIAKHHAEALPKKYSDLISYTGDGYRAVNKGLRSGKPQASIKRRADSISAVMEPLKKPMTVYRGARMDFDKALPGGKHENLQGVVLRDKGFMSTFIDANEEVPPVASEGGVGIMLRMNEGTKGAWVDNISRLQGEREFVVDRDSMMYVHKVRPAERRGPDGYPSWEAHYEWIVEAELVDKEWAATMSDSVWVPGEGFEGDP